MELELERLQEIADELDYSLDKIKVYYEEIKNLPCVLARDEESLFNCLYLIVQDRISNAFILNNSSAKKSYTEDYNSEGKSLKYSISDALYRIYDEDSINSLSEEYKYIKRL